MEIENNRLLEEIVISELITDEIDQTITHVIVNNTGPIAIKIRAIYIANETVTTLICDPSTYMDTNILPDESLTIPFPIELEIEPAAEVTVVTERGVKTKGYEGVLIYGPPIWPHYDTGRFYIGPFMLLFEDFQYRSTFDNGTINTSDYWHGGWSISKEFGNCAWNITVTNVDDRNITINEYSSITLVPNDSPSRELAWHLDPTNKITNTQTLFPNQTQAIIYKWSTPISDGQSVQSIQPPDTTCMVFLTFFGLFHEHDGTDTPFAQTIPFEAVKVT